MTSRLLDGATGAEYLNATLGQIVYFENREVTLPGETPQTQDYSDLLAEVSLHVSERWNADVGYQFDPDQAQADKSAVRFQYRTPGRGVLNLGYRFRRAELEQTDVSFALPVGPRFDVVGRWNFSLPDTETLERFLGFEYQSCCWAARFVTRRYVSTRSGDTESAIFLQLELKGLTSLGSPADNLLEHGILDTSLIPGANDGGSHRPGYCSLRAPAGARAGCPCVPVSTPDAAATPDAQPPAS